MNGQPFEASPLRKSRYGRASLEVRIEYQFRNRQLAAWLEAAVQFNNGGIAIGDFPQNGTQHGPVKRLCFKLSLAEARLNC